MYKHYSCAKSLNHTRSASLGTSSAFSPHANSNEDWTKITDLAERRRIQNRIAQRNYRTHTLDSPCFSYLSTQLTFSNTGKKLKKKLEDLEKRATSTSPSPEQNRAKLDRARSDPGNTKPNKSHTNEQTGLFAFNQVNKHLQHSYPSSITSCDEASISTRQLSTSPPPLGPAFPQAECLNQYGTYSQNDPYYGMYPCSDSSFNPSLLTPMPSLFPGTSPNFLQASKSEPYHDDGSQSYGLNYNSPSRFNLQNSDSFYNGDSNVRQTVNRV